MRLSMRLRLVLGGDSRWKLGGILVEVECLVASVRRRLRPVYEAESNLGGDFRRS